MLTHSLPLKDRPGRPLLLTDDEAIELFSLGFRFSVFRPGRERCRLSLPFETVVDLERDTLTISQSED